MKTIKLSPFAMANIETMTPEQTRSVKAAISKLQVGGIHTKELPISRLPSKQGYIVQVNASTRLTVVHEGGATC